MAIQSLNVNIASDDLPTHEMQETWVSF